MEMCADSEHRGFAIKSTVKDYGEDDR